jgi:predicted site-specific integrase-resolvase
VNTGAIIVTGPLVEAISANLPQRVAIDTRVSAAENKDNLRPKLLKLLIDPTITLIVVEHSNQSSRKRPG